MQMNGVIGKWQSNAASARMFLVTRQMDTSHTAGLRDERLVGQISNVTARSTLAIVSARSTRQSIVKQLSILVCLTADSC